MPTQNGEEKLAWINDQLAKGMTVYLQTYTRATKITAKNVAAGEEAGRPLLKVDANGSLLVIEGRRYVCADLCAIRAIPA